LGILEPLIRTKAFKIDRGEYLKAIWWRGSGKAFGLFAGVFAIIDVAFFLSVNPVFALRFSLFSVVYVLTFIPIRYLYARRALFAKELGRAFDDVRTVEVWESKIHATTDGGVDSTIPWDYILSAEKRGSFTLLFMGKNQPLIVPDSAFARTEDHDSLMAMVGQRGLLNKKI